jgi:predicted membrane protein
MSLLFVFGCVLLALATRKMETLRVEVAARPMKSFAMGIVGTICGVIAITAMCITVVGIPFALLAALLAVFSVYASIAAVLTTFGAAVAGHKWKNPYVHLLVGCVAFLVVGLIPFVGGLATLVLVMISIGALVSTRLAGVVKRRTPKPDMV